MTDSELLKKKISESGLSVSFIAKKLGISREGLYKKINGTTEFKASEIFAITDLLRLDSDSREDIFFNQKVECKSTL